MGFVVALAVSPGGRPIIPKEADMARWITQVYEVNDRAEIIIAESDVWIGCPDQPGGALFQPKDLQDAMAMSIVLRAAAKRLEDIGKGMK